MCTKIYHPNLMWEKKEIWLSLWQSPTPAEMSKGQSETQTTPQNSSITQRLRTDLGRSVGVTVENNCGKIRNIRQLMSKLGSQLPHKISDSRSQNRNSNLILDRFYFFLHNLYMFVIKTPHTYDINLWEIKE